LHACTDLRTQKEKKLKIKKWLCVSFEQRSANTNINQNKGTQENNPPQKTTTNHPTKSIEAL
tara:strand:+ start:1976 stop:2161 length:186 start_codon:yes stop_codon:yes gene_type:complete